MDDTTTKPAGSSRGLRMGGALVILGVVLGVITVVRDWGPTVFILLCMVPVVIGAPLLGAGLRRRVEG